MRWFQILLLSFAAMLASSAAWSGQRIALVVGEQAYVNTPPLANPGADADYVAKALTDAGFTVTLKHDATKRQLDQALAQFARDGKDAEAALVYFAGHGMQYQGVNYVMPVDAALQDEFSLRSDMVSIEDLELALQSAPGVKILMLDSCRDNPLADKWMQSKAATKRGVLLTRGLAPAQPTQGMVIIYATQAGQVAQDGVQGNSPFAKAFVEELAVPGLEVDTLFRDVGRKVMAATGGQQSPELSISGVTEYYFTEPAADRKAWDKLSDGADPAGLRAFLERYPQSAYAPEARAKLAALQPAPAAPAGENLEAMFWRSAEKGGTLADYNAYLKQYPNGVFSAIAANRIAALSSKPQPAPTPAPSMAITPKPTPAPTPTAAIKPPPKPVVAFKPAPAPKPAPKPFRTATATATVRAAADSNAEAPLHRDHRCAPGYLAVHLAAGFDPDPNNYSCVKQ